MIYNIYIYDIYNIYIYIIYIYHIYIIYIYNEYVIYIYWWGGLLWSYKYIHISWLYINRDYILYIYMAMGSMSLCMDVCHKEQTYHSWDAHPRPFTGRRLAFPWSFGAINSWYKMHIRSGPYHQWIGLRENLQENMVFTIKYRGFL